MKKKDKLNTITLYNEQAQKDRYGHNSTTATHYTTKKIKKWINSDWCRLKICE